MAKKKHPTAKGGFLHPEWLDADWYKRAVENSEAAKKAALACKDSILANKVGKSDVKKAMWLCMKLYREERRIADAEDFAAWGFI